MGNLAADDEGGKSGSCSLLVLYHSMFRRRSNMRRSASAPSTPQLSVQSSGTTKKCLSGSDEPSLFPQSNDTVMKPLPPQAGKDMVHGHGGKHAIESELDSMIHDHQRSKRSSTLVRASSGNVMVFSNLGNIRAPGAVTPSRTVLDYLPKTANEKNQKVMAPQMCRALSTQMMPEELKEMGNEEYKNGRYAEAVVLYDRAILMDPDKASYWSNKAAALIGLGKLLDAVADCREAVRIDPSYFRAHHRLATLYVRLGEVEKALHHYKLARKEASNHDVTKAQAVQNHISRCQEARKQKSWQLLLKEAQMAAAAGADSSPLVFAFQEEALLALRRHDEAEATFSAAPKLPADAATKFFGAPRNAYFLSVSAQIHMAVGRFEEAAMRAQNAGRVDPGSREVAAVARKARSVAAARSRGNELFKAARFQEACSAYQEGLDHDPTNTVLLCNRAACCSKLGQHQQAVDDCNAALALRPSYSKARLRRAHCYAQLERWNASVQDYEALQEEMPADQQVAKALLEARLKQHNKTVSGSAA